MLNSITKAAVVTISAVLLHLGVGSVYAWSVLVRPIMEQTGWTFSSIAMVFSITILFLGFTAAFFGKKVREAGARKSCLVSLALFLVGILLSGLAISIGNIYLLYMSYGVLVGIATGIAYLVPIPILMTWFPRNKGFATGIVVMGFGLSSTFAAIGYDYLIRTYVVSCAIVAVGIVTCLLIVPSIILLRPNDVEIKEERLLASNVSSADAIKTGNFKLLWAVFFINIFVGISILSALAPMLIGIFDVSASTAAQFVGFVAIVNGLSRCAWSTLSDYLGRQLTFVMMVGFELLALITMFFYNDYVVFQACVLILISCYGGMFATMPGYLADLFGAEKLADILGIMLAAWGVAGLIGPNVLALIYESTGNYESFFMLSIAMMSVSGFISYRLSENNLLKV